MKIKHLTRRYAAEDGTEDQKAASYCFYNYMSLNEEIY